MDQDRDIGTCTKKTTLRGGPPWDQVVLRVTNDATTGEVIACERRESICIAMEHDRMPGPPRATTTTLIHTEKMEEEEGRMKAEEGRMKEEEGRMKEEEGRMKEEEKPEPRAEKAQI